MIPGRGAGPGAAAPATTTPATTPTAPATAPADPDPVTFGEAVEKMIAKIAGWGEDLVVQLPNFVVAVLLLVLFWIAARLVRQGVRRGLGRIGSIQIARLVASIAYLGVLLAGLFVALGVVGLDKTVTSLLAGVGIIGLALGFAFQDMASNFMAGVYMSVKRPFAVGDVIETNDFFGTVQRIDLRSMVLDLPEGQRVLIPNKQVFENPVKSFATGERRVDLTCGVAYGDDLPRARRVVTEAIEALEGGDGAREIDFFWTGFGDSSIDFVVRFWLTRTGQSAYLGARSAAIEAIKAAFDREGITIPFPIRTLDFGVVGGEPLAEHLGGWRPGESGAGETAQA